MSSGAFLSAFAESAVDLYLSVGFVSGNIIDHKLGHFLALILELNSVLLFQGLDRVWLRTRLY